jgi:hypothetical protein
MWLVLNYLHWKYLSSIISKFPIVGFLMFLQQIGDLGRLLGNLYKKIPNHIRDQLNPIFLPMLYMAK